MHIYDIYIMVRPTGRPYVPEFAAILLVGAPVASDGEGLGALVACEGLGSVFALVVRLEGAEVLERPRSRVVDVVLAPHHAAVARQFAHRNIIRLYCPLQRFWPFSVL